jgi:mannitol 2-dehydrogenase
MTNFEKISYDKTAVTPGVVHVGLGNFARSHVIGFFDDLLRAGMKSWGVVGVIPLSNNQELKTSIEKQGFIYSIVMRGAKEVIRQIGTVTQVLHAPTQRQAVIDRMVDQATKLVTMTITVNGYNLEKGDASAIGLIVSALEQRRLKGLPPFTVMSCDNIPQNGVQARNLAIQYAESKGNQALVQYIRDQCKFPNSVVDRLTPAADVNTLSQHVKSITGSEDRAAVLCEPHREWIIEDSFVAGTRPPFDNILGVRFVKDTQPYEQMKLRMLNGAHMAIALAGILTDKEHVHEALANPAIKNLVNSFIQQAGDGIAFDRSHKERYAKEIITRFQNQAMPDPLPRLVNDTSQKLLSRVIDLKAINTGHNTAAAAFVIAAWITFARDVGPKLKPKDAALQQISRELNAEGFQLERFLAKEEIFGTAGKNQAFVGNVRTYLAAIEEVGMQKAMERHFNGGGVPAAPAQLSDRRRLGIVGLVFGRGLNNG